MAFHHRASVAFQMAEVLERARIASPDVPIRDVRAKLYMGHLYSIGQWLKSPFLLDDLPATRASPGLLREEMDVLLLGLVFLLLHEQAHSVLNHRASAPTPSNLASFNLVTVEHLDTDKTNEMAADAWAARAMSWTSERAHWQVYAIVRMFLMMGIGQAANGRISQTHPYVSNRLAHLQSVLLEIDAPVAMLNARAPQHVASEYDAWKSMLVKPSATDDFVRAVGLLSVEVTKAWIANGGDGTCLPSKQ